MFKLSYCLISVAGLFIQTKGFGSHVSGSQIEVGVQYQKAKISQTYSWLQTDTTLALLNQDTVVWQLNFSKQSDKPYFHPVRPVGGPVLTGLRPADHPWHRGLWFSWKLINGINYWEEDPKTGLSEGRSRIENVQVDARSDFSATIRLGLAYTPKDSSPVLTEKRVIHISKPDSAGSYWIDWILDFMVGNGPVELDRTLPKSLGGPAWGGYGGISYRAAPDLYRHRYLNSNNRISSSEQAGEWPAARWMDMSAMADTTKAEWAGVAMFDHPNNPVSPTPWYVYKAHSFAFFNAALLLPHALIWPAGHRQRLRYRTVIHSGEGERNRLESEYHKFL